jgi:hypothetical protein
MRIQDFNRESDLIYKLLGRFYKEEKDTDNYMLKNINYTNLKDKDILVLDNKKKIVYIIEETKEKNKILIYKCNDFECYVAEEKREK